MSASPVRRLVQRYARLRRHRRFRRREGACVLPGEKLVSEALLRRRRPEGAPYSGANSGSVVRRLYLDGRALDPAAVRWWKRRAAEHGSVPVTVVSPTAQRGESFADMTGLAGDLAGGVAAECVAPAPVADLGTLSAPPFRTLVLDGVQDPGNAGTLIRTAYLLGWDMVALGDGSVSHDNDKVIRASSGAVWDMPLYCGPVSELAIYLNSAASEHGFTYVTTHEEEEKEDANANVRQQKRPIYAEDVLAHTGQEGALALVLGNEGHGVKTTRIDGVDTLGPVSVPCRPGALIGSLGVASAGAILMHQLRPSRDLSRPASH